MGSEILSGGQVPALLSVICSHLWVQPYLEPDRVRRKHYRESVRPLSEAHPHTYFTNERHSQRHHHR